MAVIDIVNQAVIVMLWVMGVIIALLIIGIFWYKSTFKNKIVIRQIARNRQRIIIDKAKEKLKDGILCWKLLKIRKTAPVPPPDALELTDKGKYYAEAYLTPQGEFYYLKATGDFNPEEPKLQPITTNQRSVYVNQWRKAEERRSAKWTNYLMPIGGGLMILMVFVMLLLFWGDIVKPFTQGIEQLNTMQKEQAKTQALINQVLQNKQVLTDINTSNIPTDLPPIPS